MIFIVCIVALISIAATLLGDVSVLGFLISMVSGLLLLFAAIVVPLIGHAWTGRVGRDDAIATVIFALIGGTAIGVAISHAPFAIQVL